MPDTNPIAGLYPQPPQPQQNALLGNPLAFIPAIQSMQRFGAEQAVGNAFQGAVGGGGEFDPSAAALAIKNNPAAALAAPGALTSLLVARGQNIANADAALALGVKNNQAAAAIIAQYAQKPNPTMDDMHALQAQLAAAGIDHKTVDAWGAGTNPKNLKSRIGAAANYAMGAGNAASRQTGPVGSGGEPTTVPLGATTGGNSAMQTDLSPVQKADQSEYLADQTKSAGIQAGIRPLEQALPLVQGLSHFNFGPGSEDINKVKGLLNTLGITGVDPTSENAVRQEVNKKLLQYARGARDAGRSDSALSTAIESNPNLDLTQPANVALIKNQIGMDKQDAALANTAGGWNGYKNFKSGYYQATDPRAFQPMTPEETAALVKTMKPEERTKFIRSWNIAHPNGGQ